MCDFVKRRNETLILCKFNRRGHLSSKQSGRKQSVSSFQQPCQHAINQSCHEQSSAMYSCRKIHCSMEQIMRTSPISSSDFGNVVILQITYKHKKRTALQPSSMSSYSCYYSLSCLSRHSFNTVSALINFVFISLLSQVAISFLGKSTGA